MRLSEIISVSQGVRGVLSTELSVPWPPEHVGIDCCFKCPRLADPSLQDEVAQPAGTPVICRYLHQRPNTEKHLSPPHGWCSSLSSTRAIPLLKKNISSQIFFSWAFCTSTLLLYAFPFSLLLSYQSSPHPPQVSFHGMVL